MNGLKQLIHEIHRRSLWQVLGIFLAASWGALQVVEVLTETAGLPDWTPSMALVLLLLGLPVVLATAFVQEGMPGSSDATGDGESRDEDGEPAGGSPPAMTVENLAAGTGSLDRPSTRPSTTRRLLTWRNAILGGIGAFALLGFSLVAYFVMWSLGIGPVGSLVAQGVISDGERIVLADFDDATGEGLGDVVTEALRIDLTQAEVFDLVDRVEIEPTLRRMQVEPGTRIGRDIAREVAVRDGISASLDGSVASAGSGYLITATLRAAESGQAMATFRVSADGPDDIIPSIDKLSQDIRERSGESLRSIKSGEPLGQVTTSSLEALRLYSEAEADFGTADYGQVIDLLRRAVEIDPEFAMAWRLLSSAYQNNFGGDTEDGGFGMYIEAATQAYEHRDRLTERERLLTEAAYHNAVTGDVASVIGAYQQVLEMDPENPMALNNLANAYNDIGEREEALAMYRRAIEAPDRSNTAMGNLILSELFLGNIEEAANVLAVYETEYPDGNRIASSRFHIALLTEALTRAEEIARERMGDPTLSPIDRSEGAQWLAKVEYRRGNLEAAWELGSRATRIGAQANPSIEALRRFFAIYRETMLGDAENAVRELRLAMEEGLERFLPPQALPTIAHRLILIGETELAEEVMSRFASAVPEASGNEEVYSRLNRLMLDVDGDEGARASETLEAWLEELGCATEWCWTIERAILAERAGDFSRAARYYASLAERGSEFDFFTGVDDMYARMRLGPVYEAMGDTTRAIAAYQRVADMWSGGDARGRAVAGEYRAHAERLADG